MKVIGTSGGTGYTIEFTGDCIENMSIESRMTMCNMSIEAGAKSGLVAFDSKNHEYMLNKKYSPSKKYLDKAVKYWENLVSDHDAVFDKILSFDATDVLPQVTWGTSPEMTTDINGKVPNPDDENDSSKKQYMQRALDYMGLTANQDIQSIMLDKIFIGSCTNSRIEDLRQAAKIVEGYKVSDNIKQAIVVPGSGLVKAESEKEGLDKIFVKSGFEWREPGCSMCLAMNPDQLKPKERCASTSNRNFEGRQGREGRTHLVSPVVAAASAIKGTFAQESDL